MLCGTTLPRYFDTTLLLLRTGTANTQRAVRQRYGAQYPVDITGGDPTMGPGSAQPLSNEYRRYSGCDMKLATSGGGGL